MGIATAISSKADSASPAFTGTPTAPTAPAGNNSTQLATTAFVFQNSVPIGAILMWGGSILSLPQGYALCDGTAGTPDLRNRFIVGSGSTYSTGSTGGSADAVVVSHNHTTQVTDPGHTHNMQTFLVEGGPDVLVAGNFANQGTFTTFPNLTGISVAVNTSGESGVGRNLPPYYALAFIQRVS